jgi:hypothetical protein
MAKFNLWISTCTVCEFPFPHKGALSQDGGCGQVAAPDSTSDDIEEKAAEVEHVEGTVYTFQMSQQIIYIP